MKKTMIFSALLAGTALFAADQAAATPAPAKSAAVAPAAQAAPAKPTAQAAQAAPAKPAAQPEKKDDSPNFALCILRGLCNVCTGWLELPRCMIYDNGFMPIFGLIIGIPEGALFTVARELSGVCDIISIGAIGNTFHGNIFPHTIFQSKWIYKK